MLQVLCLIRHFHLTIHSDLNGDPLLFWIFDRFFFSFGFCCIAWSILDQSRLFRRFSLLACFPHLRIITFINTSWRIRAKNPEEKKKGEGNYGVAMLRGVCNHWHSLASFKTAKQANEWEKNNEQRIDMISLPPFHLGSYSSIGS